jgi:hypothetical protein
MGSNNNKKILILSFNLKQHDWMYNYFNLSPYEFVIEFKELYRKGNCLECHKKIQKLHRNGNLQQEYKINVKLHKTYRNIQKWKAAGRMIKNNLYIYETRFYSIIQAPNSCNSYQLCMKTFNITRTDNPTSRKALGVTVLHECDI